MHSNSSVKFSKKIKFAKALPIIVLVLLTGCINSTTQQDRDFIEKIRVAIQEQNGLIKLSDLHGGDWAKVCFTAAGARSNTINSISQSEHISTSDVQVINRKKHEAQHGDMFEWGIYFFYPPNEIEYFVISNDIAYPNQIDAETDKSGCVPQQYAYLKNVSPGANNHKSDFLHLQLTAIE